MFCQNCGKKINKTANFCRFCGKTIEKEKAFIDTKESKNEINYQNDFLKENEEFGKFWYRFFAYIIDFALIYIVIIVIVVLFSYIFNLDFSEIDKTTDKLITFVILIIYHSLFLKLYSSTPGKMLFNLRVVDAKTGLIINGGKAIGRSASYFLSSLILGLGFLLIAIDKKRQGWHDLIAQTYVIRNKEKIRSSRIIIAIIATIFVSAVFYWSYVPENTNEPASQDQTLENLVQAVLYKADYDEGYKAGYADGRSSQGQIGDNLLPPATEERKTAYIKGYLDGFLIGCKEGNFDCSTIENAIKNNNLQNRTTIDLQ
jgi:uncharacterized RDD family membrane protein YckC